MKRLLHVSGVVSVAAVVLLCVACEDLIEKKGDETADVTDPAATNIVEEVLPFEWSQVRWVSGDSSIEDWTITVAISSASIGGNLVRWSYSTPPEGWPTTSRINGEPNACIGWVAQINGQWYGAIGEWVLPGMTWQTKNVFKSDRGNKKMFKDPLRDYVPSNGQEFHLFICGLNWSGVKNVRERSNLFPVIYR